MSRGQIYWCVRAVSVEQSGAEGHRRVPRCRQGAALPLGHIGPAPEPGRFGSPQGREQLVWKGLVPPSPRSIRSIPAVRAVQIGDLTSRHLALGEAFAAGFYTWASASFNVCRDTDPADTDLLSLIASDDLQH